MVFGLISEISLPWAFLATIPNAHTNPCSYSSSHTFKFWRANQGLTTRRLSRLSPMQLVHVCVVASLVLFSTTGLISLSSFFLLYFQGMTMACKVSSMFTKLFIFFMNSYNIKGVILANFAINGILIHIPSQQCS